MNITNIRIQNFRSHTDATIELNKKSTLITGENGSGKNIPIRSYLYRYSR